MKIIHLQTLYVFSLFLNHPSCLEALRHPFLCGPRWRLIPSVNIIRWGLGSTAVRITEEYIYGKHQVIGSSYFHLSSNLFFNSNSSLTQHFLEAAFSTSTDWMILIHVDGKMTMVTGQPNMMTERKKIYVPKHQRSLFCNG